MRRSIHAALLRVFAAGHRFLWFITLTAIICVGLVTTAEAQYTIGQDASSLGSGCWQLTPSTTSQKGYVYSTTAIDLSSAFELKFQINLGANNSNGADGIMFVLRDTLNSPLIGSNGGNLGFNASSMTTNSLGIEIDTWQDAANGDPTYDHIGIQKNGSVLHSGANLLAGPVQALNGNVNIEDGDYHTFEVSWDPFLQLLKVRIDCDVRLQYVGDLINGVFSGDSEVYWGFLGTTGGQGNNQRICLETPIAGLVQTMVDVSICDGDTAQLVAGDTGVSYLWNPPLGLSSTNVRNPLAYPAVTSTYTVRATWQCDTVYDDVVVNIIQPNFGTSGIVTNASCKDVCDGEIDLSVLGGTGNAYGFDWSTSATTEDVNSLCDGTYYVTVQDIDSNSSNYLCYLADTFFITEPTLLTADIINPTKTECPMSSDCNASATAIGGGGTLQYTYLWTTNETTAQADALCPGWNWVTITDAQGCEAIDSVKILVPDTIHTTGFGDTLICIDNLAAIVATSNGGTPPFSYQWYRDSLNGILISSLPADAVTPQVTTTYYVQSFDGNGCVGDTSEVLVKVRPPLDISFVPIDTICPYDTIIIEAIGHGGDSLYTFSWEGGPFGPQKLVSPDKPTYYAVTLSDACGTPFTIDSLRVQVGGYRDIRTTLRFEDDTLCLGESTYLIASGKDGFKGPDEYVFKWSHTPDSNRIQFVTPDTTSTYVVTISDLCLSEPDADTLVVYVGEPDTPKITIDPPLACKQSDVVFSINGFKENSTYNWSIDSLDYFASYGYDSLLYRFSGDGCYFLDLEVITEFGCHSQQRLDCAVQILADPRASFDHFPEHPSSIDPMVEFTNTSIDADYVYWIIDDDSIYDDSIVVKRFFESEAPYNAYLVAVSSEGCVDSAVAQLEYYTETVVYYPNSFSPNGDGDNDYFFIESEGVQLDDFDLVITNRWGEQLFRTTRQSRGWDGRTTSGVIVPMGTYFFTLHYRDRFNIERVTSGPIHVVKTGTPVNGLN